MAKLVRRHTSNVEIIGSNPIGSIQFCLLSGLIFPPGELGVQQLYWIGMSWRILMERQLWTDFFLADADLGRQPSSQQEKGYLLYAEGVSYIEPRVVCVRI